MFQVIKRDGTKVPFDLKKIQSAIQKAFLSLDKETDSSVIEWLSIRVTSEFDQKIHDHEIQVEDIQDCVELVLSVSGYADVAKAYILYRKQRETVREIESQTMVYRQIMEQYINGNSIEESDHFLSVYSVGGLMLSNSAAITKNYWLNVVYDAQIAQAHHLGDFYIHDLDMLSADSAGWSLQQLLKDGLKSIDQKISCRPAKHLMSACNQLVNFLGIMQNEWAGAQSIPSFDTYLAPFVKADRMTQDEVDHCIESFIYGVNMPSRWGSQLPFSTIGFDWCVPEDLKDEKAIVCGQCQDFTYGQCEREMKMIQKAFFSIMLHGNDTGRSFSFPIPTVSIDEDFDWDHDEVNQVLFESASTYGTPYFSNVRIRPKVLERQKMVDFHHLYQKPSYFGYGENCGSIGMVTMNFARLAYRSKTEGEFILHLDRLMDLVARALDVKRQVLNRFLKSNLYPYTKQYIESFDQCLGTFGVIGMNEACIYAQWLNEDISHRESQQFVERVFAHMRKRLIEFQLKYSMFFNLEATPGESVSSRFVKKDKDQFPDMLNENKTYYTNGTSVANNFTEDVFEALAIEEKFLQLYTGGSAFHVYLDKKIDRWQDGRNLVKQITNYQVSNFTLSPSYSVCDTDGYIAGHQSSCEICGSHVEIWSRIAGYYQPIDLTNQKKMQEFLDRIPYDVE